MFIFTSYVQLTVMCVLYHNLSCFSTTVLLLFAANSDELTFLLYDGLSKTVSIAPVFNNTLTLPASKDSATVACCTAESSHLQNACYTNWNDL